ncbi:MAG: Uma2 family endonuclease [Acidobacteria bacterium]|nr:Uma2 family endonuclease [Acidobacteriota bacterium]
MVNQIATAASQSKAMNGGISDGTRAAGNSNVIGRSGCDRPHNLLVANAAIGIGSRNGGKKGEMYIGNMRVRLGDGLICTPDIVIVANDPNFSTASEEELLNPTVIIDVFSSRSDSLEKTRKLESFLATDSIKECLLVKQDEMRVEHYARQNQKQWIYRIYNEKDDVISIDAAACKISMQEIYAKVDLARAQFASRSLN